MKVMSFIFSTQKLIFRKVNSMDNFTDAQKKILEILFLIIQIQYFWYTFAKAIKHKSDKRCRKPFHF